MNIEEKKSNTELKNRWRDIKKQINERQLLAYRVGIPLEKWDIYMHSVPEDSEINRIYFAIQEDRKNKTLRIKEELNNIVGYRESKLFSKKIGISDTSIREIIEGKKEMAGYELINKLELFLNTINPKFDLSIENPLKIREFTKEHINEITLQINRIATDLKFYCYDLTQMANKQETETNWRGEKEKASKRIEYAIKGLNEAKENIDIFWETYIEKKI